MEKLKDVCSTDLFRTKASRGIHVSNQTDQTPPKSRSLLPDGYKRRKRSDREGHGNDTGTLVQVSKW